MDYILGSVDIDLSWSDVPTVKFTIEDMLRELIKAGLFLPLTMKEQEFLISAIINGLGAHTVKVYKYIAQEDRYGMLQLLKDNKMLAVATKTPFPNTEKVARNLQKSGLLLIGDKQISYDCSILFVTRAPKTGEMAWMLSKKRTAILPRADELKPTQELYALATGIQEAVLSEGKKKKSP